MTSPSPCCCPCVPQVLLRVLHFASEQSAKARQLCLQTMEEVFLVLRKHTRQLLPLVHKTWTPLVCTTALLWLRIFQPLP